MGVTRQLWRLFNRRERWQLGVLSVAVVLRAAVETVGVASIVPFMSVVADPDVVHRNPYLARVYEVAGFASVDAFLVALGVAVVVMLAVANSVGALTTWGILRFSWGMHHRLSVRLLSGYLAQPYGFFVQRNSASLNKTLLSEVQGVITGVLTPALDIVARVFVIAALIALLVALDPVLASVVALTLGGGYGTLYALIRKKQRQLGIERIRANHERFKASGEAFGGIKDVKVLQREAAFVARFAPASWKASRANASNAVMSQLPRYLLETIAFGGVVLIVIHSLRSGGDLARVLPLISLYAFAGFRLMPELQKLFADLAKVRFNRAALDDVLADYYELPRTTLVGTPAAMPFENDIVFDDVGFRYPGAATLALDGIGMRLERNRTVGLVGPSGSGKTTLVDLILGLYHPDSGRILVDGVALGAENLGAWRAQIGYVPQDIFLTDDSLAANIAFGVPLGDIDHEHVARAARVAHLHDFIETLPEGFQAVVGERGVRLSGGQRQRIGIARALYHDPQVLIMDEATSALDGAMEDAVMDAIRELSGKKTIILIAHRLTTVRDCDEIFMLNGGRIEQSGTYATLIGGNRRFRAFAGLDV